MANNSNLAVFNRTINDPKTQQYLTSVLAERKSEFVTSLISIVANNAQLQACDALTVMYAAMKAASLRLPFDPNLGCAYVIPYQNKKAGTVEAQFQLGYKGFVQLAQRSGQFAHINADAVYEGELKGRDKKSGEPDLSGEKTSDKVVGYFAYFKLLNGFEKTFYMSVEEVNAHAKRFSQTARQGFGLWTEKDSFDAMAKKTVLKLLLSKYAPLSVEMQTAVKFDQAVIRGEEAIYVDNAPEEQVQAESETAAAKIKKTAKSKVETAMAAAGAAAPAADAETGEIFNEQK